jgi:hypothetical protein
MSRRVTGVSGRFAGGREYSASPTGDGAKNSRCVSKEADREEPRLRRRAGDQLDGARRHGGDVRALELEHAVVAEPFRVDRQVLLADQRGPVAGA